MMTIPLYYAIIPIALVVVYRVAIKLLTPQGIPGIPYYDNPALITGDIPRLVESLKRTGLNNCFWEDCARDLGPIAGIRLMFGK
jgi:hypothetical protein